MRCPLGLALVLVAASSLTNAKQPRPDRPWEPTINAVYSPVGWQLQDAARVDATGEQISTPSYRPQHWYKAVVPGTVLTSLVKAGVYPEPLYGENNRKIPETLCHTSYWYRGVLPGGVLYDRGQHGWLLFDGINYQAEVFVNGHDLGPIKGAFVRKEFEITRYTSVGSPVVIAVHVYPPPHPGVFHEHTVAAGTGRNGGAMGQDGATFVATVGWDWIPGIRDRDTGIWQGVLGYASGEIRVRDPYITTDFDTQNPVKATVSGYVVLENLGTAPWSGMLEANIPWAGGNQAHIDLGPHERRLVKIPVVDVQHPDLWWPNGYGKPTLYELELFAQKDGSRIIDDGIDTPFGIKKYGYFVPGSKNLTITVNGVPVFCKGGNWGFDEAMKRIPVKRLEAEIRMHRDANCNMIRNWVGQSTEEDFYALCDKYGIMVWDDFWLANPADGPIPNDNTLFMANAREKVLRFRNHPSIAVWCGRNEADPPPILNKGLADLIQELDPNRFYQPNSAKFPTPTNGVGGGGPYALQPVPFYFGPSDAFHTEIGLPSIPTLESIEGMMPAKDLHPDWNKLNDDFAEHDLTRGAQDGQQFPRKLAKRFGPISNLADFVRKSQMADYDGYRAVFEGRNSHLFKPATGVLLWMSAPAQPSFVWQLFAYDLEPDAALFATEKACEPIHIQYNPVTRSVEIVNSSNRRQHVDLEVSEIYDLDGHEIDRLRRAEAFQSLSAISPGEVWSLQKLPDDAFHGGERFLRLRAFDTAGFEIADNFYWEPADESPGVMTDLQKLPTVGLDVSAKRVSADPGAVRYEVLLSNPTPHVALMAHVQLRRSRSGQRVLPAFYSHNYVSLLGGESKTITIDAAEEDLGGEPPLITLDGFNVRIGKARGSVTIAENTAMRPGKAIQPPPFVPNPPGVVYEIACGQDDLAGTPWVGDSDFVRGGNANVQAGKVDVSPAGDRAGPKALYNSERYGRMVYRLPVQAGKYLVRLHFAELSQLAPGARRFNVSINGQPVLQDFDIFSEAGGASRLLVKEFPVEMSAPGPIVISFTRGSANEPEVRAIQVLVGR